MSSHWGVTTGNYCDENADYLSWNANIHGPDGLCGTVELVEYMGEPTLKIRAAIILPVTYEEMEVVHAGDDEEEAVETCDKCKSGMTIQAREGTGHMTCTMWGAPTEPFGFCYEWEAKS